MEKSNSDSGKAMSGDGRQSGAQIAVIGMACRFPGARDYTRFWENLSQGVNSIREVPPDRWDAGRHYSPDINEPNKSISKWCGLVENIERFDAGFFAVSPREAVKMDPQQRLLLEETWRCIEDSAVSLEELRNGRTDVYIGNMNGDYRFEAAAPGAETDGYACLGNFENVLANRISYTLDLKGTSLAVNTACSSSLVALHEAVAALRTGRCDYAIVGGVNLNLHPWKYISFSKARMLSSTGQCKTFDKDADGYVPGDGAAVLLLQPLAAAVRKGCHVHGIIRGTAVNHGGKSSSITAPRVEAQRDVIVAAYRDAGFSPETVSYVEAHGTGTSLGDPIEIEALTRAFAQYTDKKQFCLIGSVKTNIGHLEAAAGLAGVIKTLLMMRYRKIPRTLNLQTVNPVIDFEKTPFVPSIQLSDWSNAASPRRAGVSSFGFGGVNAHVLLQECTETGEDRRGPEELPVPFALSARTSGDLERLLGEWRRFSTTEQYASERLHDLCATLLTGRERFACRYGIMVRNKAELSAALRTARVDFVSPVSRPSWGVWLGNPGWNGYEDIRKSFGSGLLTGNLDRVLNSAEEEREGRAAAFRQESWAPSAQGLHSFIAGYAFLGSLMEAGIVPAFVGGHGPGLWASLAASGIIGFHDALRAIDGRAGADTVRISRPAIPWCHPQTGQKIMPYRFDRDYLAFFVREVRIPPEMFDLSVSKARLLYRSQFTFKKLLEEWNTPAGRNRCSPPSELLYQDRLLVQGQEGTERERMFLLVALISALRRLNGKWNLTEQRFPGGDAIYELGDLVADEVMTKEMLIELLLSKDADLQALAENLDGRQGLLHADRPYERLRKNSENAPYLGDLRGLAGSGTTLMPPGETMIVFDTGGAALPSGNPANPVFDARNCTTELFMRLWLKGFDVQWRKLYPDAGFRKKALPVYPFQGERYRLGEQANKGDADEKSAAMELQPAGDPKEGTSGRHGFKKVLNGQEPYLRDHVIGGEKILPAVLYMEMARAAGDLLAERTRVRRIRNVIWFRPIAVSHVPRDVRISLAREKGACDYTVSVAGDEGNEAVHGQGRLIYEERPEQATDVLDINAVLERCPEIMSGAECYERFGASGFRYGPGFRSVREVRRNRTEAVSRLVLPVEEGVVPDGAFPPALIDGALQTVIVLAGGTEPGACTPYLPFAAGEVEFLAPLTQTCYAYASLQGGKMAGDVNRDKYDVTITDETGQRLVRISDFSLRAAHPGASVFYYTSNWEEAALPGNTARDGSAGAVLVFDEGDELRTALREELRARGTDVPVFLVKTGDAFSMLDDETYRVNPGSAGDYEQLLDCLSQREIAPRRIVHRWSRDPFSAADGSLADQLDRSIRSVFLLTRALLKRKPSGGINMACLYSCPPEDSQPAYAALSGFAKSVRLENRIFNCKVLAFQSSPEPAAPEMAGKTLQELGKSDENEVEIRYQEGRRFVKRMKEIALERENGLVPPSLPAQGCFIITGGAGGLGLLFAEHLARTVRGARLVLVGRSGLTPQKTERLKLLDASGAEAVYLQADVSGREDVERVVSTVRTRFGRINGIVHAAGVIRDSLLVKKTEGELKEVSDPKIYGAVWLDETTKEDPPDFVVFFSSTAAVLGNIGQCDYAYANSFLDAFAEWREQQGRPGKTLSINWPLWKEGGMQVDEQTEKHFLNTLGIKAMETGTGLKAFEKGLAFPGNNFMVIEGDRLKLNSFLKPSGAPEERGHETGGDSGAVPGKLIDQVSKTACSTISVSEGSIDVDCNIQEYGFDSFSYTDLANRLNEQFKIDLMPTVFFERPSIASICEYLWSNYRDSLRHFISAESFQAPGTDARRKEEYTEAEQGGAAAVAGAHTRTAGMPERRSGKQADAVAVIGMSGTLPGSENLEVFWKHLEQGDNLITEIPPERWDWKAYYGDPASEANKTNIKWGGFIEGADRFDASFFGISSREADLMDPRQRIFLETVWKTVEDAGYKPSDLSGTRTGVYAGVAFGDYDELVRRHAVSIEGHASTGLANSILTNRVSYLLNLHGPSEPIDTACSSSLVAIHRGVEAIRSGRCEMAIAGGVNLILSPLIYIAFNKTGMLSEDGRCKTFDHRADGYVRSEGAGAVLLKSLRKAEEDGDHIYGVIRGIAINHGGRTNSLTAPNPAAQAELLIEAYEDAGIDFSEVSYIETHGTGTRLGDPVEIEGLKKVSEEFRKRRGASMPHSAPSCGLGSVKTNIGHLEAAAGIAGVLKVLLSLKYRKLPANLHFEKLNPYIGLEGTPFSVVCETREWKALRDDSGRELPRIAGVSSFGFGGVNAHVVIEEYREEERRGRIPRKTGTRRPAVVTLSARNEERLREYAIRLLKYVEEQPFTDADLDDIAYTLQAGREAMEERLAMTAGSLQEFREKLAGYVEGRDGIENVYRGQVKHHRDILTIFDRDEQIREAVGKWIEHGKYAQLLELWVRGLNVDWSGLYKDAGNRRVSLPSYPFARERHWIQESKSAVTAVALPERPLSPEPPLPFPHSLRTVDAAGPDFSVAREKPSGIALRPLSNGEIPAADRVIGSPGSDGIIFETASSAGDPDETKSTAADGPACLPARDLEEDLTAALAEALYVKQADIDRDQKFVDMGVDSIIGVEWVRMVNRQYGVSLPATRIYDYPTIREFAAYLEKELNKSAGRPGAVFPSLDDVLQKVRQGDLDAAEADRLLHHIHFQGEIR